MATLPDLSIKKADKIVELIYAAYESKERKGQSERIGASELGKECGRALWYSFRWSSAKSFGGRMLRLFQSGHLQEPRVVDDLRSIGCVVQDVDPATGKQFKLVDGVLVGKLDGIVGGVPGAERTTHVLEIKTHSAKSFAKLVKDGVKVGKTDHYLQAQLYMHWWKLDRALYVAVCKDTDELHIERLDYDKKFAEGVIARGKRIAAMATPPEKLRDDPAFFQCRFCDHYAVCHMDKVPQVNCRTCAYSTPEEDGSWTCTKWGVTLSYEEQQEACDSHLFIPDLVPGSVPVDSGEDWVEYESNGTRWKNGKDYVTSKEIFESTENQ